MPELLQQTQPETQFYQWRSYRCAYEVRTSPNQVDDTRSPLLLLHPIGVGLSRRFWNRFCQTWFQSGQTRSIYSLDLLGCGDSDMPHVAYSPEDWAEQLQFFLQTVVKKPVVLVAQGALLPVAIALIQLQQLQNQSQPRLVQSLVLSGPPAWAVMTKPTPIWQQKLLWNLLFDSPAGRAFYEYARRRQFIASFSVRQLFAEAAAVDEEWLHTLVTDAKTPGRRYAVFSFLAGFWRKNWETAMTQLNVPTLVVVGDQASSISKSGKGEDPGDRLQDYLRRLPQGQGVQIAGRNVLPYESTELFVEAIAPFIDQA
ncbi:MAG: alpha/beta fold hydrolase [Drouetiella hepatica Uher 2000/2452]|jgi:pimeloyl-ACP methyl ester carboxylesterase|uniref:Alpha/beta fold hydrolase n=1 Tax=Drouetiella hepatica Uher 2000/2452 TaxID=904376 RepID=A0A951QC06_9CYAN|nr:alpha/beta fold hydrolase [Drouetiella hepatica Uher 2000/2452]